MMLGCWVEEVMKTINCDGDIHITLDKFKKPNKDGLVKHLIVGCKDLFQNATTKIEEMKDDMFNSQKSVI